MITFDQASAAKATLRTNLDRPVWLRGVGIGMDDDGYFVKVNVAAMTEDVRERVPPTVGRVPVRIEVVGDIEPQRPRAAVGRSGVGSVAPADCKGTIGVE